MALVSVVVVELVTLLLVLLLVLEVVVLVLMVLVKVVVEVYVRVVSLNGREGQSTASKSTQTACMTPSHKLEEQFLNDHLDGAVHTDGVSNA